jgi:hypothetical protein
MAAILPTPSVWDGRARASGDPSSPRSVRREI